MSVKASDPAGVTSQLVAHDIVVSHRGDGVRFSFHFYNNMTDVEAALEALDVIRRASPHLFDASNTS